MIRGSFRELWLGVVVIAAAVGLAAPANAECTDPTDPTCLQGRPIQLGVSGSSQTLLNINNLLYCYAGTLGALVTDGSMHYILSNNHVLAKENETLAYGSPAANDTIIQEANLDEGACSINSGDSTHAVADLTSYVTISFYKGRFKSGSPTNTADAAIAEVRGGEVDGDGYILDIGTIGGVADVYDANSGVTVGSAVQKTGRTTAHTFGKIEATDVTVDVSYDSGKARFEKQIRIRRPCDDAGFSDAGDSGSLIATVEDGVAPHAVGLLFAGGSSDTFANPIAEVLSALTPAPMSMVSASTAAIDPNATTPADYQAYIDNNCPPSAGGSGGGGGGGGGNGHGHGPPFAGGSPVGLQIARDAKARHSNELFALPDVVGHGVGSDRNGNAVIEVYVSSSGRRPAGFPTEIEGVPVRVIATGPIRAY